MKRKKLFLPNFCIASIYSKSSIVDRVLMPIGRKFDEIRAKKTGRDNELDDDTYNSFFLTAVELVDVNKLGDGQFNRLKNDRNFRSRPLFLATFVALDSNESLVERQSFINAETLHQLRVGVPEERWPIGDKKSLLSDKEIDWTTRGQYWGWARPRVQSITIRDAAQEVVGKVAEMLGNPHTPIRRSPLPCFWTPSVSRNAVVVAAATLGHLASKLGMT